MEKSSETSLENSAEKVWKQVWKKFGKRPETKVGKKLGKQFGNKLGKKFETSLGINFEFTISGARTEGGTYVAPAVDRQPGLRPGEIFEKTHHVGDVSLVRTHILADGNT